MCEIRYPPVRKMFFVNCITFWTRFLRYGTFKYLNLLWIALYTSEIAAWSNVVADLISIERRFNFLTLTAEARLKYIRILILSDFSKCEQRSTGMLVLLIEDRSRYASTTKLEWDRTRNANNVLRIIVVSLRQIKRYKLLERSEVAVVTAWSFSHHACPSSLKRVF